ncbi:MAG: nicotinamide-nucleotide adenylyltransferase [Candidatus Bathyarchaeia archaeon]
MGVAAEGRGRCARGLAVGLYVGRFQPFHAGHLKAIGHMLERMDELIIAVGSAQYSHTSRDPFTAGERIAMIRLALDEAKFDRSKYMIIPIPDVGVHAIWVSHLLSYVPKFDVCFTNEPLTSRLFKEAGLKVEAIPFFDRGVYSAREIRRRILKGEDWRALLPPSVANFIESIGGIQRIRDISRSDELV